ncbi:hypothetical protein HYU45_01080 [Candidatus Daviesbacteria bacterium]|nr:hypothetical protein [Candidatus Daviesbacteria bacterium]
MRETEGDILRQAELVSEVAQERRETGFLVDVSIETAGSLVRRLRTKPPEGLECKFLDKRCCKGLYKKVRKALKGSQDSKDISFVLNYQEADFLNANLLAEIEFYRKSVPRTMQAFQNNLQEIYGVSEEGQGENESVIGVVSEANLRLLVAAVNDFRTLNLAFMKAGGITRPEFLQFQEF